MPERDRGGGKTNPVSASDVGSRGPDRRTLLKTAATGAVGGSFAGCLESYESMTGESDDEPVTIGLLAPSPGSNYIGQSMVRAARVAVATLNEQGGIDDREVELEVADTNASPLEARREYQRLALEADADVTVGIFDSASLVNVLDDIAEQQTIHLTSGAATSIVSRQISADYDRYKYHFRVGPTNDLDLGRGMIDFLDDMAPELGWDSIALLAEDYDWTEGPWSVYQERLDDVGLDVVMQRRYSPSTDDFEGMYEEIEDEDADATIITTAHTGTEALLDWVRPPTRSFAFGGIHVPMQLPSYYDQTGGRCRYGFSQISATAQSDVGDLTQDFVEAYRDRFSGATPVYTGYTTYDAIVLFADAVDRAGTLETDAVIRALEETSFSGSTGTIEFYDRDHEHPHDLAYADSDTLYFQWQENEEGDGVQEVIWPEEHATSEYVSPPWA